MIEIESLRRMVRQEILRAANVILVASAGTNNQSTEDIENLYSGVGTLVAKPKAQPYGFNSRAPRGTRSVVARIGDHPHARVTIGHLDPSRNAIQEGETELYNNFGSKVLFDASGNVIWTAAKNWTSSVGGDLSETITGNATRSAKDITETASQKLSLLANNLVELLKSGSASPFVLGDVLKTGLDALCLDLETFGTAIDTFATACSSSTDAVLVAAAASLAAAAAVFVTAVTNFQTQYVDTPATNFLSQKIMGDRGA